MSAVLAVMLAACASPEASLPPVGPSTEPESTTSVPTGAPPATGTPTRVRCPGPEPPLVTDRVIRQMPALAEPTARVPFRDPVFGRCLIRVTDREKDPAPGDTSGGLKNEYSRVQAFNADERLLLVRGTAATWYLYDATSLLPLRQIAFDGFDPRWDARDPDLLYYSADTRLLSLDVSTDTTTLVHDFAADFPGRPLIAVWSRFEGSPSADGRYWGFMAQVQDANQDWRAVAFVVFDLHEGRVVAKRDLPAPASVDSVSISPSGTYFTAYFDESCEASRLGTDDGACGFMVYDRDLRNGRGLHRAAGHGDLALDAERRDVLVFQDNASDYISLLDLETGRLTPLWFIDFSHEHHPPAADIGLHVSGRAFGRPGWASVSTHDGDPRSYNWMDDQVLLIELKVDGRVLRLAHARSLVDPDQEHDYWAEPQASVNRDLTRVLFTTNWGRSGSDHVEAVLIELPPDWPVRLP